MSDHLRSAAARLADAGVPDPMREARRLWALVAPGGPVDADEALPAFEAVVARRAAREPFSHISGERAFWKGSFRVTSDVLDPRPETETLVALALEEPFARVLDLGTGTGAIIVSLLAERPEASGVGIDMSDAAIQVAFGNAERAGVVNRLGLIQSDWLERADGLFDLIVSNPPYIAADEMDALEPEVRDHEPRAALTDEGDGLSAYRAIAAGVLEHLLPNGRLLVEVGPTQAASVRVILEAAGLERIAVHPDLDGRDRVVSARAPA